MKRARKSAGRVVVLDSHERISAEKEQIEGRIRQRAFEISQSRGHQGREVDNWLSAESEIISMPPAELVERDTTYVVQMALAGVHPDDLEVVG